MSEHACEAPLKVKWQRGVPDEEGWWLVKFECDSMPCIRKVERRTEGGSLYMLSSGVSGFGFPARDFHGMVGGIIPEPEEGT